ncbi:hypothetical protein DESPIG_00612 [Desulfovibrio piger ATCC 29098]|uniref:Uncharacterized protein n=1 Tax=Desulfovibrio piger ATCC 29098 TaxID=411464 RepID=B6WRC3_9BACT|nr:hypothetical protein DESPIG_00612 [Desulfovibrio piger ATCC 29098]
MFPPQRSVELWRFGDIWVTSVRFPLPPCPDGVKECLFFAGVARIFPGSRRLPPCGHASCRSGSPRSASASIRDHAAGMQSPLPGNTA